MPRAPRLRRRLLGSRSPRVPRRGRALAGPGIRVGSACTAPSAAPAATPATADPQAGSREAGAKGGRCSAPRASPSRGRTHLTNPRRPLPALRGAHKTPQSAPPSSERRTTAGRRRYTSPRRAHCAGSRRGSVGLRLRRERGLKRPGPAVGRPAGGGAGAGQGRCLVGPEGPARSRAPWRQEVLFPGTGVWASGVAEGGFPGNEPESAHSLVSLGSIGGLGLTSSVLGSAGVGKRTFDVS